VRRDVFRGKVWTPTPFRVVSDTRDLLALALWPGVERLASTHQPALSSPRRDEIVRTVVLPDLASGRWELAAWTWETNTKLTLLVPGAWFSVDLFFRDAGDLVMWYVNFERPFQRTPIGIDTFDLLVDLVIEPDGCYQWKDESEYAQARQLGIITDDEHRHVQVAREQVLALLDQEIGPFDQRWRSWRRGAHWRLPTLPANATTLPPPAG
jgi:protein associated with RNAse G/E